MYKIYEVFALNTVYISIEKDESIEDLEFLLGVHFEALDLYVRV